MISVENATMRYPIPKRYREHLLHPFRPARRVLALYEANVKIADGDCVALVGPNGAGKTTLLKMIGGLLYPSHGQVLIDGVDTIEDNLNARLKVGMVINEDRSFYWRLTGAQNLEFFGVLENLSGDPLQERIATLLTLVGLSKAGYEKRVSDYSSGMRQRLAIARGLLADPEVLLLDEPTKSLDLIGASDIRQLISDKIRGEKKRALVVATNQLADVTGLCDYLFIVSSGRVVTRLNTAGTNEEQIAERYREIVGKEA
jgi:ABC-2 type transport system ATP-binding protein